MKAKAITWTLVRKALEMVITWAIITNVILTILEHLL